MKSLHYFMLFLSAFSPTCFATPIDLSQAFKAALEKNEGQGIAKAQTEQSGERVDQLFGRVLPQVSLLGTHMRQDTSNTLANIRASQTSVRLNATQAIFRGLSDIYAYKAAKAQEKAQQSLEYKSKLDLYSQVAQAYYDTLPAEKNLANLKSILQLSDQRRVDIRQRVKIGRSRRGDLLSAESQIALTKAQVEEAAEILNSARQNFLFVTGLPTESSLKDDPFRQEAHTASLELYLDMVEKRPDIIAQKEAWNAADQTVAAQRGQHFPSLDLSTNYYLRREGFVQNGKWDVGLTLTIPIFAGFSIDSAVGEAVERRKEEELRLAQFRRNAAREIRTLFQTFKSNVAQYHALESAVKTAEESYKVQQQDYRHGLVTNLDVLQTLNVLQDTRRSFDRAHYQSKAALVRLQAAVGQIPETP